jgi:hypothetical protein
MKSFEREARPMADVASAEGYMAELSRLVDPQIALPVLNDPQFQDPGGVSR